MMTAEELDHLRYRAHAYEAQSATGYVLVPQKLIRLWEKEILELRSVAIGLYVEDSKPLVEGANPIRVKPGKP